jgi:hypothetical protein
LQKRGSGFWNGGSEGVYSGNFYKFTGFDDWLRHCALQNRPSPSTLINYLLQKDWSLNPTRTVYESNQKEVIQKIENLEDCQSMSSGVCEELQAEICIQQ